MNVLLAVLFVDMLRSYAGAIAIVFSPIGLAFILLPLLITYLGIRQGLQIFGATRTGQLHLNRLVRVLWMAPFFNALALVAMLLVIVTSMI